ncbi:MAG TPA: Do family serine endopeptidase [Burkholderiales bacterium]|nr:Do family serine endopeptidase [Burkholderiales bacterium]
MLARLALAGCLTLATLAAPAQTALPGAVDGQPLPTLAPMLARVTPAVVNIAVVARAPMEANPLLLDPFFRRFFGVPDQPQQRELSAGSGVIVDAARGLVMTNHHVVKDAQEIVVGTKDRRVFKAELVGSDPGTDIALLRIPAEALTAVPVADSDRVNVGDFVVAIGNPFGIGQTVTSGIVSAVGRSGLSMEGYEEFIQTDASINPGNSGGALVNLRGELVGINSAIFGPGANIGIGFAVPINMARAVMDQILRFGEVRRGRLGVTTQDVTPAVAKQLGLTVTEGAVVQKVEPGSTAEQAGLRTRDVVTATNGRPIRSSGELRNRIGLTPVGEEVDMTVLRDGRQMKVRARIGEPFQVVAMAGEAVPQLAGARVADLAPGMPMYGQVEAVVVASVDPASPALKNGLRAGDLIYGVNRTRVRNVKQLFEALRAAEQPLRLGLLRGEQRITLVIR